MTDPRRSIPAVDALLSDEAFGPLVAREGRARVVAALREVQRELRSRGALDGHAGEGAPAPPARTPPQDPAWYAAEVADRIRRVSRPSLRRVINATGVVLHTNLGRAPLAAAARAAMEEAAGYASLEYDLDAGGRGSRHAHCVALLRELTGAGDALVVNNNAAALVLALGTLAGGRDALISRGELVEIGGSFRVPEIMARSGARMVEVGATNRTHLRDYRERLGPDTGIILKVHRSNFRVEGFTSEVPAAELAALGREAGVPLIHDLGSGAILDLTAVGLPPEPTARNAVEAGATVVTLSGDKLLGGPQSGILLGDATAIDAMRRNPLCRAFRPGKLTLAALEATLALYRRPERAVEQIPALRMLAARLEDLGDRARSLAARLVARGIDAQPVEATSKVGGGAYPGVELRTVAVAVSGPSPAAAVARRLREAEPAVVARVREDRVLLDPRTIDPAEEGDLEEALVAALGDALG